MDETCSFGPFARIGKQVRVKKGPWTCRNEENLEEKKTTYKRPKCWWGHQPLKWGRVPTKLTIIIEWGLRVFMNLVSYEKSKVHKGGSG